MYVCCIRRIVSYAQFTLSSFLDAACSILWIIIHNAHCNTRHYTHTYIHSHKIMVLNLLFPSPRALPSDYLCYCIFDLPLFGCMLAKQ